MAKNNLQSESDVDFDLEQTDDQPDWDTPQLLAPADVKHPNTTNSTGESSERQFLEVDPLVGMERQAAPTIERETLRAVLSQRQLNQLVISMKSGNEHSSSLLSKLTSSPAGVTKDDPVWNAVSYLSQNSKFANAIQAATLDAYTQGSNKAIFKVIADAAEDPSLAAHLRFFAHHGVDSDRHQTQRLGLNVLLSMPKTWNDADLKSITRDLGSDVALQFHDASFGAPRPMISSMKKSLMTAPQLDEQQTKMLLLGVADPRTIGPSERVSLTDYLPASTGKPGFPVSDDSSKPMKADIGEVYKRVFRADSPYEDIVAPAKPLTDTNYHTDTRYVDAILAQHPIVSSVDETARTSQAIFASWGMPMNDSETRTKLAHVAAKLGEQQVRNIDTRIAMINALDPASRMDITGSKLEMSRTQVAGQLLNGALTDISENAFLLDNPASGLPVDETIKQRLKEKTAVVEELGDKLFDSSTNKSESMSKLMSHTESGVTLANRAEEIFTCKIQDASHVNGTERFRQAQAEMANSVSLDDRDIKNLVSQLGAANQSRSGLSVAVDSSTYQSLVNDGKREVADLFALGMLDKYGAQALSNLNPSLFAELSDKAGILQRTHGKGITQFAELPQWSANGYERFPQALDCLRTFRKDTTTAGLDTDAIRRSALQILDGDESLQRMTSVASTFAAQLGDISELYDAASKGTKYDNYVALVREKAHKLEEAMDSVTPEHVAAWKTKAAQIEQALTTVKDDENRVALEKRLASIQAMIETFGPEKVASLKEFLGQIQSRDFDADSLSHWLKANSIVIVATSVAVTATLMTYGAASPLVAACLSAGVALSVSQATKEGLYLVNHHVGDTGFGNYNERSYAGAWASKHYSKFEDLLNKSGERSLSETAVEAQKAELAAIKSYVTDVLGPLTAEYGVNVVASLATIGIVRFSQVGVESLSPTGLRALVTNQQSARLLEAAARTENESARRLISAWLTKASLESGREVLENIGEESLSAAAVAGSRDLGIQNTPSGFFVSTAIALATAKRGSKASVSFSDSHQVSIHPDFQPAMMRQLINDGHKVVRHFDGSFEVSSYSDPKAPPVKVSLSGRIRDEALVSGKPTRGIPQDILPLVTDADKAIRHFSTEGYKSDQAISKFIMETAEGQKLFKRTGVDPAIISLSLNRQIGGAEYWSNTGEITANPTAQIPYQFFRHELVHFSRQLERSALAGADPEAFRDRLLGSVANQTGTGTRRTTLEQMIDTRAILSDDGRRLMSQALVESIRTGAPPASVLESADYADLSKEAAFVKREDVVRELEREVSHFGLVMKNAQLDRSAMQNAVSRGSIDAVANANLLTALDQKIAYYQKVKSSSGGSLIDNPSLIKLTSSSSQNMVGRYDMNVYWKGAPEEMAARRATHSESLHWVNDQLRAKGMNDAKVRRDYIRHNYPDVLALIKSEAKAELAQRYSIDSSNPSGSKKTSDVGTVADVVASAREKTSKEVHASILFNKSVMRAAALTDSVPLVKKQSYRVRVEKVQEDGVVKTLEAPEKGQTVKAGQFIVTRIDEKGEVIYEPVVCADGQTRLMRNQWPAAAVKNLTKTYHSDQDPLVAPKDAESKARVLAQTEEALNKLTGSGASVDLWTRVDAPPVSVVRLTADIKVTTPWGAMSGKAGDWLSNYDYKIGEPGRDFAIITAASFRQTYEANDEKAAAILSRVTASQSAVKFPVTTMSAENRDRASASLVPSHETSQSRK